MRTTPAGTRYTDDQLADVAERSAGGAAATTRRAPAPPPQAPGSAGRRAAGATRLDQVASNSPIV